MSEVLKVKAMAKLSEFTTKKLGYYLRLWAFVKTSFDKELKSPDNCKRKVSSRSADRGCEFFIMIVHYIVNIKQKVNVFRRFEPHIII